MFSIDGVGDLRTFWWVMVHESQLELCCAHFRLQKRLQLAHRCLTISLVKLSALIYLCISYCCPILLSCLMVLHKDILETCERSGQFILSANPLFCLLLQCNHYWTLMNEQAQPSLLK